MAGGLKGLKAAAARSWEEDGGVTGTGPSSPLAPAAPSSLASSTQAAAPPLPPSPRVVVVGGRTGSGKTSVLRELARRGEQVLDLEELAAHFGSAFGRIGQERPQPSSEQMFVRVAERWLVMDPARPVFCEDEGPHVGDVQVPPALFRRMRGGARAPRTVVLNLQVPLAARVHELCQTYLGGNSSPDLCVQLERCTERIAQRLGHQRVEQVRASIAQRRFDEAALVLLAYYDRRYDKHLRRDRGDLSMVRDMDYSSSSADGEALHRRIADDILRLTYS